MARKIKIDGVEVRFVPISVKDEKLQDCDIEGKPVFKKEVERQPTIWQYEDGTEYDGSIVKLIDGVPAGKFEITKEIEQYIIVPKTEALDYLEEKLYFVDLPKILQEKIDFDNAFKFVISVGSGYKEYFGFIYRYADGYVMKLSRCSVSMKMSEFIAEFEKAKTTTKKVNMKPIVAQAKSKLELKA